MKKILPILLLALFAPAVASAADGDFVAKRIRLAMETTHAAVASEDPGTANHAARVVIVRNWITNSQSWVRLAVVFVETQAPAQLDTCTGDALNSELTCAPQGTQAAIDTQMSVYLSVLVGAGHGG